MRAFAAGEIDVLVSTTVIEVGVDVANATTMVLLDADRFGISQLHQLRGRVGRGGLPGLCLLVSRAEAGTRRARAARRRGRHHRRLRAEPGRPRAAPRGRRPRPLPVRLPLDACRTSACSATRRRSSPPAPPPRRCSTTDADLTAAPAAARRASSRWRSRPRASSWRSPSVDRTSRHDADHRGQRRRAPDHGPPRTADAADDRPGARGAVLRIESWCGSLQGLRFLDLYAGSGAVGLEAWSRGAGVVTLVESDRRHRPPDRARTPRRSASRKADVVTGTVAATLARPPAAPYDVAFLDPPYPLDEVAVGDDLALLDAQRWLVPGAMVVVERSSRSPEPTWPAGHRRAGGASATARPRFGTVTPLRTQRTPRRPDAPSRLPRVLRPGHQRAPRHRPARRGLFDEVIVAVGVNVSKNRLFTRRGAHRRCSSRGSPAWRTSGSRGSPA